MNPTSDGPRPGWDLTAEPREGYLYLHLAPGFELTPVQTYDHASLAARLIPGLALACCFRGYRTDEQTEFLKVAAMNRGARVEFFEDLNAARRWLVART